MFNITTVPESLQGPYLLVFYPILITVSATLFLVGACFGCWYCDRVEETQKQTLLKESGLDSHDITLINKQQSHVQTQAGGYVLYNTMRTKIKDPFFVIAFLVIVIVLLVTLLLVGCYYVFNVNFVK